MKNLLLLFAVSLLSGGSLHSQLVTELRSTTELRVDAPGDSTSFPAGRLLFDGFQLLATGGSGQSSRITVTLDRSGTEFVYKQVEQMTGRSGSSASFGLSGGTMPQATTLTLQSSQVFDGTLELSWSEAGLYPATWDLGARIDVDADGVPELDLDSVTGQTSVGGTVSMPLTVGPTARVVKLETWGWMTATAGPGISGIGGTATIRFVPAQCDVTQIGAGCGPTLDVQPTIDNTLDFTLQGVPAASGSFGFLLFGEPWTPLSIGGGCDLFVTPSIRRVMITTGGTATLSVPLGVPDVISVQGGTLDGGTGNILLTEAYELDCS